ncbi:unnamed protein product [Phytophthora fragariaefolia]|uniref:glucan endo-1,3-beta-D-glucosidase n=1 Tax=Phytophthora fragariaefolia TaxID=1490495 RepID=A0A9W6TPW3_9STRA|nr:unnamed protein product [Phytophthora fragariaefolia]
MKFFTAAVAMLAAHVSANGVCYDPNHASNGIMNADTVRQDMNVIRDQGFNAVRTYISKLGDTNLGLAITKCNLTAALGVPYPQSDYVEQMDAALTAANSGGVGYIFVGNENLAGAGTVPKDMISLIKSIKSLVPSTVKVGTVQRNTEVINSAGITGWAELIAVSDVLGVNVHPYFDPDTTANNAIDVLDSQWKVMEATSYATKLVLTETGWPSDGTLSKNSGSVAGQETFFSDYKVWSKTKSETFYFQIFDTPYKVNTYEKSYGLLMSDSTPKFNIAAASQSAGQVSP